MTYNDDETIYAPGGFCAPISTHYWFDLEPRPIYEYPDRPDLPSWDLVIAPRLTQAIVIAREARRRVRVAWRALTTPLPKYDADGNEW